MRKWIWWLCLTILAVGLSFIEWRYPLPTGSLDVQVMGIVVIGIALGVNVALSYVTFALVALTMLVNNLQNWWTLLPVLLTLVIMSILLRGNPSLDAHMAHSQAINFGLITGAIQLVGMLVVVTIQALMITAKWDALTAMLGMALPAALLNGLLDCLLVPPLTLGIRHYTECFTEKKE